MLPTDRPSVLRKLPGRQAVRGLTAAVLTLALMSSWLKAIPAHAAGPASKSDGTGEPIKIGFVTSLSTELAGRAAHELVDGIKLYFSTINNNVAGRHVEIIVEDDEGRIANAVAKTRKLVDKDHVDVLTGVVLTPIMYALTPLVTSYHIPYVGCFSGADDVTKRKRSEWVMRTSYSNSQPMHPFGVYAAKQLHYKRIATIGMDYQYCWELVGGFQQTYENAGGQIVQKLWAANGTEDFADVVSKLRTDVDAVLIATSGKSAEYLPKYVRAANPKIPILGAMTSFDEDVIAKVGTPFDGAVGCSTYCAEIDSPDNKRFVKAFRQAYGKSPGWYSENGYTNGLWIATAIEAMHGNLSDKEKFRIALRSVKLHNAPRGPIEMDAFGNPIDNVYIRRLENVNGQIQSSIIFTYSKVSQFWTWKPEEFMAQPPYSRDYPPCTHCEH